jgi:GAF domain-containing protein
MNNSEKHYRELAQALSGLLAGENNWIANCANFSALLFNTLPDLNWAGFYLEEGKELVLGPFQGKPACVRIPFGKGVCGSAAASRQTQRVADVHCFPGHIACDLASRSEIVIPLIVDGELRGLLDLDSPIANRFSEADQRGLEGLCREFCHHHEVKHKVE